MSTSPCIPAPTRDGELSGIVPYIESIGDIRLLTRDEEADLARRARGGDRAAREELIRRNLRLVISIARKYKYHSIPLEDMIGHGNEGLIRAVDLFDPAIGIRLSTYATYWIRQRIMGAIRNEGPLIRIPTDLWVLLAKADLRGSEAGNPRGIDPESLPDVKRERLALARRARKAKAGLDESTEQQYGVFDGKSECRDGIGCGTPDRDVVAQLLAGLSGPQRDVICRRYGLDGGGCRSIPEIARGRGLSPQRIRNIACQAMAILRREAARRHIDPGDYL